MALGALISLSFLSESASRGYPGCVPGKSRPAHRPRPGSRDHSDAGNLNVLLIGPAGIGKSWICCALGNRAARDGFSVLYKRLSHLLDELAVARLHGRQARALTSLARTRVLLIDDWAMVKLTAEQRRDLMEVIDDRHDRGSTVIATQIPVDRWHDQIGDPTYADAILDRLVHNAYRFELRGESMRRRARPTTAGDGKIIIRTIT